MPKRRVTARAGAERGRSSTIKLRAYKHIRRGILDAKIPVGSALSEYELAQEIGVSRTPVREALKLLEQEGLVRSVARRGTFVAELTARDILEIYQIRIPLEALAARVASERMERADVDALIADLDHAEKLARERRTDAARMHALNMHKRIIDSTSNSRLIQLLATLDDQIHRIRQSSPAQNKRVEAALIEHRGVLKAIRTGDPDAAEKAMRAHVQAARDRLVEQALAGTTFSA